jgi:hypothetical protein
MEYYSKVYSFDEFRNTKDHQIQEVSISVEINTFSNVHLKYAKKVDSKGAKKETVEQHEKDRGGN